MKKQLFLIGLLFSGGLFAQQTPEFEFQLYFEDAAGNKDTVTLGYDVNATDTVNFNFDEVNILNQPWASDLDVRIGNLIYHGDEWGVTSNTPPYYFFSDSINENTYLTKKKVVEHFCDLQYESASRRVSIQFVSNNFPIVVKWDKTPFVNFECIGFSMLYGVSDHMHTDVTGNYLLRAIDSIQILGDNTIEGGEIIPQYFNPNNPSLPVYVIQFNFVDAPTNSIDEFANTSKLNNPFPNPISQGDFLNINVVGEYQIVNRLGQIVQEGGIKNGRIPVNTNESGLYILKIQNVNNKHYTTKIIIR